MKDVHRTTDPKLPTFAGVVSRGSVRIALAYATLNNIDVNAADKVCVFDSRWLRLPSPFIYAVKESTSSISQSFCESYYTFNT